MGSLGTIRKFLDQVFPPSPTFNPETGIPDLTGKVAIVTGGNSGLGKATIKQLLLKNAKVYMASRSQGLAEEAIRDLKQQTGKEAIFLEIDLSSLEKVTRAANEFKSKETELHILFNSAATLGTPPEQLSDDGLDLQFATNVLGPAHFTLLLIPELTTGAKSSPDGKARVVNVSSGGVYLNHWGLLDWKTLESDGLAERRKLGSVMLYNQSKYGVVAFSNELARRYVDQGIISSAVNPGAVRTRLFRRLGFLNQWFIPRLHPTLQFTFLAHPPEKGALTQLYVGTSPETKDTNGGWFFPFAREFPQDGWTRNPQIEAKLWDWIEEKRKRSSALSRFPYERYCGGAGGNSGVGKETVKQLLLKNAKVYMASRSRDRAEEEIRDAHAFRPHCLKFEFTILQLKQQTGKEAIFLELDLSGLEKVTKAANEFKSKETELHILFNSAATLGTPPEQLSDDGLDLQFGTNVLGHAHFTLLLIPELAAGAKSSADGKARVVNVSSSAVYLNHRRLLDWKTLETDGIAERRKLGTVMLYNQSKYGVLAFSNELARRYVDQGVISNALNPGAIRTRLFRRLGSFNEWVIFTFLAHLPEKGALTQLYVGTSPETKDANGKWFAPFARECPQDGWTRNPEIEAKLWDWIEEKRKRYC
ncbi:hypothetical protein FS837_001713 [Tulasnella sp. UAMH 9824]|nr:hypothetical protein FS837_001713 [Tulasnella sp. UAMH 9824]